ncbi:MAG: hypothetical protein WCJ74_03770 [bacterium]
MDVLALRDNAKEQLQQIKNVETGIEYLNKVRAIEVWAKAEKKDAELQNMIAEQKIRTQRILGQLIQEGQQKGEIRKPNEPDSKYVLGEDIPKTLSDIGISRKESSTFQAIASIDVKLLGTFHPDKIGSIISKFASPSIKELNTDKKSIGLIDIKEYRLYWDTNKRYIDSTQYGLFEDVELADFTKYTKSTKDKEARIYFRDTKGEHDLQYNEWQIYEYQRKFSASLEAFRFMKNKNLLMIGNMHNHRNIWIGLGMFEYNSLSLF